MKRLHEAFHETLLPSMLIFSFAGFRYRFLQLLLLLLPLISNMDRRLGCCCPRWRLLQLVCRSGLNVNSEKLLMDMLLASFVFRFLSFFHIDKGVLIFYDTLRVHLVVR